MEYILPLIDLKGVSLIRGLSHLDTEYDHPETKFADH